MITISLGTDHRGYELKSSLLQHLQLNGYSIIDHGTDSDSKVDYPDFAYQVGKDIQDGQARFGILICNSGIGMSIAANRMTNIRAALCRSADDAKAARKHNDANILVLGSENLSSTDAFKILDNFLTTDFEKDRHALRLEKIEKLNCRSPK